MTRAPLTREEVLDRAAARVGRRALVALKDGRGGLGGAHARRAMKSSNKDQLRDLGITFADVVQHALGKGWILLQGEPGPTPPGTEKNPGRIIPGPTAPPTSEEARTTAEARNETPDNRQ